MTTALPPQVVQSGGRKGGNRLERHETPDGPLLLKIYRGRRASWRAPFRWFGHLLEGKTGTSPEARHDHERMALGAWRDAGVPVPQVVDRPLPAGVAAPALWMTWHPGPTLRELVEQGPAEAHAPLVEAFGGQLGHRQATALERGDRRLIHEHASIFHVLVHGETLVNFDLEIGYRSLAGLRRALEQELGAVARSILRARPDDSEPWVDALVRGYGRREMLVALAEGGAHGMGPIRWVRRLRGALRRRFKDKPSKADGCRAVLEALARVNKAV